MLGELKNFDAKRMDLTELVSLAMFGRNLLDEFEALGVEAPEWVAENVKAVRREVKSRNADRLAAKIKSTRAQLETLKTPNEKKASLKAELAKLEKQAAAVEA